jgi:AsmA protein
MARRAWRYGLLGLAVVVVLAVAAGAVFIARFNPNSLKPRIEAAVKQATGRDLALNGPIGMKLSLWPTVELHDAALANPPGYSRADMATLGLLDLRLAILPLLHGQVEISRLILVHPNILLEQDAQGHPNWRFTPAPAGTAPPAGSPASASSRSTTEISVHDVQIEGATLGWRDDRTGRTETLAVKQLTAKSTFADAPLTLAANATYNGVAVTLGGQTGPLSRLQQPDADSPWPVKLTLAAAGASVSVNGALTHPLQGRGYTLTVDGSIPDLTALAPLLAGVRLPPLHDVHFATRIADSGGPVPRVEEATLHLGAADLNAYVGGLRIVTVDIDAPAQDKPVRIAAQVTMADTPVTLAATVGAPPVALLAGQPAAPVPVDLTLQAANASLTVKGAVAHPETLSGADLALAATIPDLSALSPLAHRRLPAVTQIAFQGQLTDAQGGFLHGATLHNVTLTTAQGDLSGTIGVSAGGVNAGGVSVGGVNAGGVNAGPPPTLTGKLHAGRIDADALLAAAGRPVPNPPPPTGGASPPQTGGAPPQAAPPPPPPRPAATGRLFPDTPIPFGLLRQANADLAVSVGDLKSGGSDYRSIDLHVVLQDGKLRVDPLSADLPEGALTASLNVDASTAAPPVAMKLHAPGLEVAPLFAAAGLPGYASGKLEVYADLHSAGDTPHAIAAGLDGSLGLAMQNGTIDTQLLNRLLGPVLQKANLLGLLSHGGSNSLRCFALRADAQRGVADLRALVLNSSMLSMDGTGSVNLGEETLAVQLRPQGRLAGTAIVVPLRVTGPIRSPDVKVNALGAAAANAGTVAGAVIGSATPLGLLGGVLGGDKLLGKAPGDTCAGPLALARGQTPPAAASGSSSTQPKPSGPAALFHDLLR